MKVVSNRVRSEMSEDYSDVAKAIGKMTKHLGADASDAVSEASRTFAAAASDLADQIKSQSESVIKRTGKQVRQHPLVTVAIATAAVGFVGYAIARLQRTR